MAELTTDTPTGDDTEADPPPVGREGSRKRATLSAWAEIPLLLVIALVLALLLKTFVVQAFFIPSSSMEPTLEVGDRVLVTKTAYLYREPVRGEVVVFTEELEGVPAPRGNAVAETLRSLAAGLGLTEGDERDFIKRIIGMPGDTLELRGGVIYIDGEPLPEAPASEGGYLSRPDLNDFGPVVIEPGHYFMLGDNRPNSADSRFGLGQIHRDQIVGRAFVTIWPLSSIGSLPIGEYDP